jgi:hypothetical protein
MVQTTKSRKHSNTDLVGFEKNQPVRNEMDEMEPTSRDRTIDSTKDGSNSLEPASVVG